MSPSQSTLLLGYLRSPVELVPKDEPASTTTVTALEIPNVVSVLGVLPESTLPLRTSVRRYWIRPRPEVGPVETLLASLLSVLRESSTLAVVALGQEQCGYVTAAYTDGDRIALLLHTLPYRTSLGDAMEYLQPVTRPMNSSVQDDTLRTHLLVHPDDALEEVARLLNHLPASVNTLDACLTVVSGVVAVHHYGQLVRAIHQQIQDKQK
ncbi:hypothetical protein IWQ61_004496 [Dispira simplex]|nr:hypothetical protein IWQ61_004496 [Dispira simplex]